MSSFLDNAGLEHFWATIKNTYIKKTQIDSSISSGTTSTNVPTSMAVSNFVEYKLSPLGDASTRGVDTSISYESVSTNVPTSKAVSDLVGSIISISADGIVTFY